MIDGMVIVGYLVLYLAKAAGRQLDRRVDRGLDDLVQRIGMKFRRNPAADLARNPTPDARLRMARAIEHAARQDRDFARDINGIVHGLDRLGGRNIVNNVQGNYLYHGGGGDQVYGGSIYKHNYNLDPYGLSSAPSWLKAIMFVGFLGFLSGIVIVVLGALSLPGGFKSVHEPTDIPTLGPGLATMAVSFAVLMITQVIAMLSRRH